MVSAMFTSAAQSYLLCISDSPMKSPLSLSTHKHPLLLIRPILSPSFASPRSCPTPFPQRRLRSICFFNAGEKSNGNFDGQEIGLEWPILKRWDVPWQWQTASLTSLACGLSFVLTGLAETGALPLLGIKIEEFSLDEKVELLLSDQSITTAVTLGVIYSITNTPSNHFLKIFFVMNYVVLDLKEPFDVQKGWILWAVIGLVGALVGVSLTGFVMSTFIGKPPQRETDSLVLLLPLLGNSSTSMVCLLGITGVLAPILEETVFRGFFMVSLTKWVSAVLVTAAVFASFPSCLC